MNSEARQVIQVRKVKTAGANSSPVDGYKVVESANGDVGEARAHDGD